MRDDPCIDFVIPWVDDADQDWLAEKAAYTEEDRSNDSRAFRFRDWGFLRYWFRAVEANAPWVRTVHFVTSGHIPDWLDTSSPKLHIVNHRDYIPEECLPTFSSRPIELNFHRIEGLAEQFVFFNDDMFVGATSTPETFFRKGLPVDLAALNVFCYSQADPTQLCVVRDVGVVNKHFDMKSSIKAHRGKWISPRAGRYLPRTLALLSCPRFPGFVIHHCAQPFLKSTYEQVWDAEPELLHSTCLNRFRDISDVNCWLMKEWQLASGSFTPAAARDYRCFFINTVEDAENAAKAIRERKTPHLCINDSPKLSDELFLEASSIVRRAFESVYGAPSSFEKRG